MADDIPAPSVGALTKTYVKIRDARAELSRKFKEEDEALVAQLDVIKRALLDYCTENGVESARTEHGMFYRTSKTRYWTSDWESMHKFILENELPEFLDKRLNQRAVREYLDENPESVPPGLNTDTEYVVTVRKK